VASLYVFLIGGDNSNSFNMVWGGCTSKAVPILKSLTVLSASRKPGDEVLICTNLRRMTVALSAAASQESEGRWVSKEPQFLLTKTGLGLVAGLQPAFPFSVPMFSHIFGYHIAQQHAGPNFYQPSSTQHLEEHLLRSNLIAPETGKVQEFEQVLGENSTFPTQKVWREPATAGKWMCHRLHPHEHPLMSSTTARSASRAVPPSPRPRPSTRPCWHKDMATGHTVPNTPH